MSREERERAIEWFSQQMKIKLLELRSDTEGDWRQSTIYDLLSKMKFAQNQLRAELRSVDEEPDYDAIVSEAANVANYACAIADVARILKR